MEGIDGSGKSTQCRILADALGALCTREPGATALGRAIRTVVLEPGRAMLSERAEALLMAADRAAHVAEVLGPSLAGGRWVVTDRYSASTLAYQGYGRGLELVELERLVDWATGGLRADLTVLVDVPVQEARARRRHDVPDRIEAFDDGFHHRVRTGYLALAARRPEQWVVVDGSAQVDSVARAIATAVAERLGPAPAPAS